MTTPLGTVFSTVENQVSQCDDQTFGSIAEMLAIHFNQERFEQLLSGGSTSPLHVRKEVSVARPPLWLTLGSKSLLKQIRLSASLLQPQARLNRLYANLAQAQQN